MQVANFWPAKSAAGPRNESLALLEQQADLLTEYDPTLAGRVVTAYAEGQETATISLYVVNNKLYGYNYRLLSYEQPLSSDFPVTLWMHYKTAPARLGTAQDAGEFAALLKQGLSNASTKAILDHLITMGDVMHKHQQDEDY